MTRTVAVAGAGLAGSMLAAFLAREGHEVAAYESRPDLRRVEIDAGRSINLALATRGITALDKLGVMEHVEGLLTPMRGRMVHARDGETSFQPYGNRPDEVIYSVSRSDLNGVLLDAAERHGATIRFDQRCIGGSIESGVLRFRDSGSGEEYAVDIDTVFGTDGANSPIRDMLVAASATTVTIEPLDHGYKELTIPAGSDGDWIIDPNALHIWPRGGFMLIALANLDGSFTCTLFVPTDSGPHSLSALVTSHAIESFFEEEFRDFAGLVPDLADQYLANPDGALGTVRCNGWHLGDRAVILGDAAHAIVPFHGQGMNAAFESCSLLMDALADHPADWDHAFGAFESERKPDVDAIADMALDNYIEMRSSVADERYVLRRELALELERRWPDRFTPRYAMVMFSTIPYAVAQERARLQAAILEQLTRNVSTLADIDFELAAELIGELPR